MERMNFMLYLCGLSFALPLIRGFEEYITKEFVVKVDKGDWDVVRDELETLNTHFLRKIIPEFYLFEDSRYDDKQADRVSKAIEENSLLKKKVQHFERIREYVIEGYTRPIDAGAVSSDTATPASYIQCPTFADMGVEAAWDMGYTGKGVVIAITDVGINTDIPDIQPNIKPELSYNYVNNAGDITPERCHWNTEPDHGNRCAGVVAAVRNNLCGDGIDFEGGIAGIKIAKVTENSRHETCNISFQTAWIGQGLQHAIDKVDIYSNSWGSNVDFISSSELVKHTLHTGTKMGRNGKGAIYVFPAGSLSDPYTNSIHTIAVSSVDHTGRASKFSSVCACTLTSAYGEPSNTGNMALHTTSNKSISKCTLDFEGTSAATAIVSGIIGLALQANPDLTWRDIQDLVVHASSAKSLPEYNSFHINGAGKSYDPVLGFGLLNATTLVCLAKTMTHLPEQLKMRKTCSTIVTNKSRPYSNDPYVEAILNVTCDAKKCINRTETVVVNISYESPSEYYTELIIRSPHGTDSLLMDRGQSVEKGRTNRTNVVFQSVHFWGETAEGQWTVAMTQRNRQDNFKIISCDLTIYGTGYIIQELSQPTHSNNDQMTTPDDDRHIVEESRETERINDGTGQNTPVTETKGHDANIGQSARVKKKPPMHEHVIFDWVIAITVIVVTVTCGIATYCLYLKNQCVRSMIQSVVGRNYN